jgi:hypothetical protein
MKVTHFAIAAAAFLAATSAPVFAHRVHPCGSDPCATKHHGHHHKHHAKKIHYSGKHGVGYYRRGPKSGYGFGFSSYKGDPFGADDYYDGGRCHYLHNRDFCYPRRYFNSLR